jgi:adenine C2-methylase RlmN of 23S rRNA A2503 and tRNA A37
MLLSPNLYPFNSGMGEPLANYRNVLGAVKRMNDDLGIGARKITISTVGVVPNIKKLMEEDIQVRLALSLHCANDEERSALLPANRRYGGLDELMKTIREYIYTTNRRVTLEWALIENENDTPEVARQLGQLLQRFEIRRDMVHINVIPLNPTGGFKGSPSGRKGVHDFVSTLDKEFGLKATPRVRRGIDIDAGCGQLKAAVKKKEEKEAQKAIADAGLESSIKELKSFIDQESLQHQQTPIVGVYEDDDIDETESLSVLYSDQVHRRNQLKHGSVVDFEMHDVVDLDDEEAIEFEDEEFDSDLDKNEAARLIQLVQASFPKPEKKEEEMSILSGPTTTIVNEEFVREAKKKRKKILKNLKAIDKLKELEKNGTVLNDEQKVKIRKEEEWRIELESVEHNLQ